MERSKGVILTKQMSKAQKAQEDVPEVMRYVLYYISRMMFFTCL
jgi:hypothetical protein